MSKKRNIIIIILSILALILIIVALYFTFFFAQTCSDYACFEASMIRCERTKFISEDNIASWGYEIKGKDGDSCAVTVNLLQAKEGELGINKLVGYDMTCYYPIGLGVYPERELDKCHGRLKEELQGIIIKKLHAYIIENIGEFKDSLNSL